MEMRVEDPGRDEIQITEPRRPKKRCSLFFLMDIFSLMDLKVDTVYLMDFQMQVEDTGENEIQIREHRLPKEKFFLKTNIFFNFSS